MQPTPRIPPKVQGEEAPPEPTPLKGIPFPPLVVAMALITGVAFLLSISRLPSALGTGIDLERAHRLLETGDGVKAIPLLEKVTAAYPRSVDPRIDLLEAYDKAGRLQDTVRLLNGFDGASVDRDQASRLDAIEAKIKSELPPDSASAPKGSDGGSE